MGLYDAHFAPGRDEEGNVSFVFVTAIEVTDKARSQQALRESEERQAFLLRFSDALREEDSPDALAQRALRMLCEQLRLDRCFVGVYQLADDRAEFTHQVGNEFVPPLPVSARLSDFPEALQTASDQTLVVNDTAQATGLSDADKRSLGGLGLNSLVVATIRKGENTPLWSIVAVSAQPRWWTSGEATLLEEATERTWVAIERSRAQNELRSRGEQFETLVNQAPIGVYVIDADFRVTQVNQVARPAFGDIPDLIGRDFNEVMHVLWGDPYASENSRLFRHTLETGEPYFMPERAELRADRGRVEYYTWRIDRIPLPDGRYGLVCYFSDISEQVRTRLTISESEEKYRELFERIEEGFCIIEVMFDKTGKPFDYRFLEVNPAFEAHTGIANAPGRLMRDIAPDHEQHWFDYYGQVARTGEAIHFEAPAKSLGGRHYEFHAFRVGEPAQNRVAIVFSDITQRQQEAALLRESEEQFRRSVLEAPIPVIMHAEDGEVLQISRSWTELTGYTMEDRSVIQSWLTRAYGIGGEGLRDVMKMAFEDLEGTLPMHGAVFEITTREGEHRHWSFSASSPGTLSDGRRFVIGMAEDITERVRAEAMLRENQERQAFLLTLSDAFRIHTDAETIGMIATRLVAEHLRVDRCYIAFLPRGERLGHIASEYKSAGLSSLAGDFRFENIPQATKRLETGQLTIRDVLNDETLSDLDKYSLGSVMGLGGMLAVVLRKGQGKYLWCLMTATTKPREWTNGELKLLEDVAERIWAAMESARAEAAVRESENRFRQFGDASSDALWMVNAATGQMEYLSPAFERIWGIPRSAVLDDLSVWAEMLHPEDRDRALAALPRSLAGEAVMQEYRIVRGDGEVRYITDVGFPILDAAGQVVRVGGIAQDLTERREAEEAVRTSERRQRALIEGVPQLVWRAIDRGHWTWASPQWTNYTGQAEADSHGQGWLEPIHPEDREDVSGSWDSAIEKGEFYSEYRLRHGDENQYRWFQTRATPVRDDAGRIIEWLGTSTDVHELRGLQERQKVLVAELQHRTFNLMSLIRSTAEATIRSSTSLEEYERKFSDRIASLARVQRLLSRLKEEDRVTFDELIRGELDAAGALGDEGGRVTLKGPKAVALRSSTVQTFAMALHELTTNAVKYGALKHPGAHLDVHWRVEEEQAGQPWLHVDWRETGVPMPEADAAPQGTGQGRLLIEGALPYQLNAKTTYVLTDDGVRCSISLPVSVLTTKGTNLAAR